MKTIKGPAVFLAQFADDKSPFNSLDAIGSWVSECGFKGVQIPSWEVRLFDLATAAQSADYCDEVKAGVFNPIAADPAYRERLVLREVRIDSNRRLVGVKGNVTSHRSFATDRGITIVPTLEFLDSAGLQVSRPLIGVSIPDYYGAYVDSGIERAIRKLRAQRSSS